MNLHCVWVILTELYEFVFFKFVRTEIIWIIYFLRYSDRHPEFTLFLRHYDRNSITLHCFSVCIILTFTLFWCHYDRNRMTLNCCCVMLKMKNRNDLHCFWRHSARNRMNLHHFCVILTEKYKFELLFASFWKKSYEFTLWFTLLLKKLMNLNLLLRHSERNRMNLHCCLRHSNRKLYEFTLCLWLSNRNRMNSHVLRHSYRNLKDIWLFTSFGQKWYEFT